MPVGRLIASGVAQTCLGDAGKPHVFTFSDNYRLVIYLSGSNTVYATEPSGSAWSGPTTLVSGVQAIADGNAWTVVQVGDTLHLWYTTTTTTLTRVKIAWNATTHSATVTSGTYALTNAAPGIGAPVDLAAVWDAANSRHYLFVADGSVRWLIGLNDSLVLQNSTQFTSLSSLGTTGDLRLAGASQTATVIYAIAQLGTALYVVPITLSAGNPAIGTVETATPTSISVGDIGAAFDTGGHLDLVFGAIAGGIQNLYTVKRAGTNAYGGLLTLASNLAVFPEPTSAYNSSTGDLWVFYVGQNNQANGEVYVAKRTSGVWTPGLLAAGGDATGYSNPNAGALMDGSGNVDLLYVNGTSTFALYDSLNVSGAAPNTPKNVTPSGYVNGTAPTIAWTSSNATASDTKSASEILITRISDSVVMCDTGKVSSTVSSSACPVPLAVPSSAPTLVGSATGGTLAAATYQYKVTNYTAAGETPGSASSGTYVATGTTSSIALSSIPLGPAGTVGRKVYRSNNGGASYLLVQTITDNTTTTWTDTGATATTAIPTSDSTGLTFGVQYQVQVKDWDSVLNLPSAYSTAVAFTPIQGPVATITSLLAAGVTSSSSPATIGSSTFTTTVSGTQAQSHAMNAFTQTLYASDGVTVIASTGGTLAPQLASGGSVALPPWLPAGIQNSTAYKLAVSLTDAVTGVVGTSTQWSVTTSYAPPAQPTGFTAVNQDDLGYVQLLWTNPAGVSSTVYWRTSAVGLGSPGPWTVIKTNSSLLTALKVFAPINVAYDYAVTVTDSTGIESNKTIASHVTLGLKYGAYGHWLNALSDPLNTNVALGGVNDFGTGSHWDHNSMVASRYVPDGRTKPTTVYGLDDYFSVKGRTYFIPASDNGVTGATTTIDQVMTQVLALGSLHGPHLYRDPRRGMYRVVTMENDNEEVAAAFHGQIQFDMTEVDGYTGFVLTA